jgi:hypothetical protein
VVRQAAVFPWMILSRSRSLISPIPSQRAIRGDGMRRQLILLSELGTWRSISIFVPNTEDGRVPVNATAGGYSGRRELGGDLCASVPVKRAPAVPSWSQLAPVGELQSPHHHPVGVTTHEHASSGQALFRKDEPEERRNDLYLNH